MRDHPGPPAAAYHLVAALLPAGFFLRPPVAGARVVVVGADGRASIWVMDTPTAWAVTRTLRLRRDCRVAVEPIEAGT